MSIAIAEDPVRLVSAVTVLEASTVVLARYGQDGVDDLDLLLIKIQAEMRAFAVGDLSLARLAYDRYGKGRHPRDSTLETASPMHSRSRPARSCFSKVTILSRPTSNASPTRH